MLLSETSSIEKRIKAMTIKQNLPPPILHEHQGDRGEGREEVDRGDEGDGGAKEGEAGGE